MSWQAMEWVFKNSPTKGSQRLVEVVLAEHAHADGSNAYPSVATIAREANVCERTVQYALRRLTSIGRIVPEGFGPKGTIKYRVVMSQIAPEPPEGTVRVQDATPTGVQPVAPTPVGDWPTPTRATARWAALRRGEVQC